MRKAKGNVVDDIVQCPFCFQEIQDQGKRDLISSIEKVLSKEVEVAIHRRNKIMVSILSLYKKL